MSAVVTHAMIWINLKDTALTEGTRRTTCDFTEMPRRGKSKDRVDEWFPKAGVQKEGLYLRRREQKATTDKYRVLADEIKSVLKSDVMSLYGIL